MSRHVATALITLLICLAVVAVLVLVTKPTSGLDCSEAKMNATTYGTPQPDCHE